MQSVKKSKGWFYWGNRARYSADNENKKERKKGRTWKSAALLIKMKRKMDGNLEFKMDKNVRHLLSWRHWVPVFCNECRATFPSLQNVCLCRSNLSFHWLRHVFQRENLSCPLSVERLWLSVASFDCMAVFFSSEKRERDVCTSPREPMLPSTSSRSSWKSQSRWTVKYDVN